MSGRALLRNAGIVLTLIGLFFLAQGRGWLPWPATSPMVGNADWVTNGAVIAVVGLAMVLVSRRMR